MSDVGPTAASLLEGLNPAQLKAVQFSPDTPIQILAGPGSGKTKVLTSRIAYMILQHAISPSSICAVTFTNKAANEMRERLKKLIGPGRTEQLKMGTFHALCARFLRIHPSLVGLDANFTICDADESQKIIGGILKKHKDYLEEKQIVLTDNGVQSIISKAKGKGKLPCDISNEAKATRIASAGVSREDGPDVFNHALYVVGLVYEEYELTLRRNNALDFDDLLLYGVRLCAGFKHTISWCKYVLVDEFQDTNTTQYSLMTALAIEKRVTVVGDPDQSIYGWRSAEVENLARMCRDFRGTEQIFLEQNYRSTASILKSSLAIVAQDKKRIPKSLHTSHPSGSIPFLCSFLSEHAEALFIVIEIKKIIAHMGGALSWGDVAILLRFNALSRVIESTLQQHGIPCRVLGGHKFFERKEVKDILAYLQLVDNPNFNPALVRASNVPSRGIGDKTLKEIAARAEKSNVSQLSIMEGICNSRLPDIKPSAKKKLSPFVKIVGTLHDLASNDMSPADLIRRLVDLIGFEDHLKKTQPDWESRWENVKELITFATEISNGMTFSEKQADPSDAPRETPLRSFLQASMLSSEGDNDGEENSKDKVTISTCHAAKGLEWPVVMIPSVEDKTFPFSRSEDEDEERRLLYVACTRAQGLLYLTHAASRTIAGNRKDRTVSPFISVIQRDDPTLFTDLQPRFFPADRKVICDVLRRSLPAELEVANRISEFERMVPLHLIDNLIHHPAPPQETTNDLTTTFTSSSTVLRDMRTSTFSQPSSKHQHYPFPSKGNGLSSVPSTSNPATTVSGTPHQLATSHDHQSRSAPHVSSTPPGSALVRDRARPIPKTVLVPSSVKNSSLINISGRGSVLPTSNARTNFPPSAKLQLHPLLCHDKMNPQRNEKSTTFVNPTQPPIVTPPPPKPNATAKTPDANANVPPQGTKRRLGMGRTGGGYTNKKFKPPGS